MSMMGGRRQFLEGKPHARAQSRGEHSLQSAAEGPGQQGGRRRAAGLRGAFRGLAQGQGARSGGCNQRNDMDK